ncbi:MAG: hypothetical protein RR315_05840 [Oscillospiraceae bacterium]
MEKLKDKTIKYTAGSGKMLLYLIIIMELTAGACAAAFGVLHRNGWLLAMGLLIGSFGMLSAAGTSLAPLGEKIVCITSKRFYLSGYTGISIDRADFSWIDKVEVLSRAGKKIVLIYTKDSIIDSNSHNSEKHFIEKNMKLYGAPIALSEVDMLKLGVNSVNFDELSAAININMIKEKIIGINDDSLLSSRISLSDQAELYMVGSEAQICSEGVLIKLVGEDFVTLFHDSELDNISVMVSNNGGNKEAVIILLYKPMNFLLISNNDPVYKTLFDALTNMRGFDINKFNEAYEKAENTPCRCFSTDSHIESANQDHGNLENLDGINLD